MVTRGQRFLGGSRNRVELINTINRGIEMNYETKMMFRIFRMFEVELREFDKHYVFVADDVLNIMKDCIYRGIQQELSDPGDRVGERR